MATGLEKKAEKSILESIDKLVGSSFLMLLFESVVIRTDPTLKDVLREKSVKGIYDYLVKTISDLKRIVDEAGEEKEFHLRKCLQMKSKILEIYDDVKTYVAACNIIDLCIEDMTQCLDKEEDDPLPFSELRRLFRNKAEQLLNDAVEHDVEEAATAILFTVLPNHFNDSELIDYITYSSKFYFENSSKTEAMNHVKQIMRSFAPHKTREFGRFYAKEGEKLSEIIETIRLSDSEVGKSIKRYEKIFAKVEGIADALSGMYSSLTYISILLSSMFTCDDILKGNTVYSDYFHKAVDILNSDRFDESIVEALLASMDDTIEKEVEQLNEIAKRKELIYKNVNFESFTENTKTLFSMEFFLTTAFFENIEDIENASFEPVEDFDEPPADIMTAQKELKALKLFIQECCLGMSEPLKTSARRNLFLSVPLASYYDRGKMLKYIDKMCSQFKSTSELEGVLSSIEKIIDEELLLKLSVLEF